MKYRTLTVGTEIKDGDEYYSSFEKRWYPTDSPGWRVTEDRLKYRRPIKAKKISKKKV